MSVEFFSDEEDRLRTWAMMNPAGVEDFETPILAGFGSELYRAPMRAFAGLGAAGTLAAAGALRMHGITAADDALFSTVDRFRAARDYWSAEPGEVGVAGRVVGGLTEFGTLLGLGLGNPALAIGATELNTAADLATQGVDPMTAVGAGVAEAATTAAAFQVPFFGKTLAQRILFGAGANVAGGAGVSLAVQQVLERRGYAQQAEAYDPWNLEARAVDVLAGALFGGVSHRLDARRAQDTPPPQADAPPADVPPADATLTPEPEVLDAVAALNAHRHRVVDLAPGRPRTPEALDAHVAAIRQAVGELAADQPVTASVRADDFETLPPSREVEAARQAMTEELGPPAKESALRTSVENAPTRRRLIPALLAKAQSAIRSALSAAKENRQDNPNFVLMPVAREAIEEAATVGWDLNGYSHAVDRSAILHIFKRHGDAASEAKRGQLPVSEADLELIPEVIGDPDYTIYGLSNKIGRDLLAYIKRMPDGSTLYLEERRTGRRTLSAQSMRRYPGTTSATSVIEGLRPTSGTLPGDAIKIVEHRADRNAPTIQDAPREKPTAEMPSGMPLRGETAETRQPMPRTAATTDGAAPTAAQRPRQPAGTRAPDLDAAARTDAARATLDAAPDLQITDDDGNVISAADALAAADAELAAAETLAPGAEALASCAIRFIGD